MQTEGIFASGRHRRVSIKIMKIPRRLDLISWIQRSRFYNYNIPWQQSSWYQNTSRDERTPRAIIFSAP
jgi:hypothetical protein